MAAFVVNEWLWADSSGENGPDAQRQAFQVITMLANSDHQIVIIEGSAFDQKAWKLCKSPDSMVAQRIAGLYVVSVRQNSDRCVILKPHEAAVLPDELALRIKSDDHYLVQALLTVGGSVLVTTDEPLLEIAATFGLRCSHRHEFLAAHL